MKPVRSEHHTVILEDPKSAPCHAVLPYMQCSSRSLSGRKPLWQSTTITLMLRMAGMGNELLHRSISNQSSEHCTSVMMMSLCLGHGIREQATTRPEKKQQRGKQMNENWTEEKKRTGRKGNVIFSPLFPLVRRHFGKFGRQLTALCSSDHISLLRAYLSLCIRK